MVERVRLTRRGKRERVRVADEKEKRQRAKANRMTFTDLGIRRLRPPKEGQLLYWDAGQKGLALLVSSGGTKTFRSQFKLNGRWLTRSLGRFGEVVTDEGENTNIAWARDAARRDRTLAREGIDPRERDREQAAPSALSSADTYGAVVDQFIEKYAKPRQRTWAQTESFLKGGKKEQAEAIGIAAWLGRPFAGITKADTYQLLDAMIAAGHGPKAGLTLAWLRTLWRWGWKRDIVAAPIMDTVEIEVEPRRRDKVFNDAAIAATWRAADRLSPTEGAFIKLMVLLAPRKAALAGMRWSHLDDVDRPTLWTTPPELVKQKKRAEQRADARVYLTPLPLLAQRIIRSIPRQRDGGTDLVFPSSRKSGVPVSPTGPLTGKVIANGGPADFAYHAWRHTVATWLKDQGHDLFDRGLVLNHAEAGVTARYSHGYSLDRKRKLLGKWADHVEQLTTAEGVTLLR